MSIVALFDESIAIIALNRKRKQSTIELPPFAALDGASAPIAALEVMPRRQRLNGGEIAGYGAEAGDDRAAAAPAIHSAKQKNRQQRNCNHLDENDRSFPGTRYSRECEARRWRARDSTMEASPGAPATKPMIPPAPINQQKKLTESDIDSVHLENQKRDGRARGRSPRWPR